MSGKRVLWRDRCDERVRERRRRQGRVMAAMAQAAVDGQTIGADEAWSGNAAAPDFDISSWLMLGQAGEAMRSGETPLLEL